MDAETLIKDIDNLLEVWVAGWAGCRGLDVNHDGRFHYVVRNDERAGREYFAHEPDDGDFDAVLSLLGPEQKNLLTILSNDPQRYIAKAADHGLSVDDTSEAMMVASMDTQDREDPWLSDDDLEAVPSGEDGRFHVDVRAGDALAASGDAQVVQGRIVIFDRIDTNPDFRRRGLGTFVMKSLTARAFEKPIELGLLLASPDGQALYTHLGWSEVSRVISLRPQGA